MVFHGMSSYWNFDLLVLGFLNLKQLSHLKVVSYSNKHTYGHTLWTEYLKKGNEGRKEKYLKSYFHKGSVVFHTVLADSGQAQNDRSGFACCLGTTLASVSLFPESLLWARRKLGWCAHCLWWVRCNITLNSLAVSRNLALLCDCENRNSFRILYDDSEQLILS